MNARLHTGLLVLQPASGEVRNGELLVLPLSLPSHASAKNNPQKDFDLACAVAAGASIRTMPNFKDTGFTIYIFYLGRLSERTKPIGAPSSPIESPTPRAESLRLRYLTSA
jgi:hypothetical protein